MRADHPCRGPDIDHGRLSQGVADQLPKPAPGRRRPGPGDRPGSQAARGDTRRLGVMTIVAQSKQS